MLSTQKHRVCHAFLLPGHTCVVSRSCPIVARPTGSEARLAEEPDQGLGSLRLGLISLLRELHP
jgi:hypothetical protein